MSRQGWPTNSKDICIHNAAMLSSKCEIVALRVAHAWVAEIFSKCAEQEHVKKLRPFLWFELATVTPQALNYDVINFGQQV